MALEKVSGSAKKRQEKSQRLFFSMQKLRGQNLPISITYQFTKGENVD